MRDMLFETANGAVIPVSEMRCDDLADILARGPELVDGSQTVADIVLRLEVEQEIRRLGLSF